MYGELSILAINQHKLSTICKVPRKLLPLITSCVDAFALRFLVPVPQSDARTQLNKHNLLAILHLVMLAMLAVQCLD